MDFKHDSDRVYLKNADDLVIAQITFPPVSERIVEINHTFVDPSLRGQGVGALLVRAAAEDIRERGLKAKLKCSFAQNWFEEHPEFKDLLEGGQ